MDQEERIIRLEELAYFQEERLRELNEALTAQQQQIDTLEHRLAETMELARPVTGPRSTICRPTTCPSVTDRAGRQAGKQIYARGRGKPFCKTVSLSPSHSPAPFPKPL